MDNFPYWSMKTLELFCRGGSNEGAQCMFWLRNKKNYL